MARFRVMTGTSRTCSMSVMTTARRLLPEHRVVGVEFYEHERDRASGRVNYPILCGAVREMLGLLRFASGVLLLAPRRFEEVYDGTEGGRRGEPRPCRCASVDRRFGGWPGECRRRREKPPGIRRPCGRSCSAPPGGGCRSFADLARQRREPNSKRRAGRRLAAYRRSSVLSDLLTT